MLTLQLEAITPEFNGATTFKPINLDAELCCKLKDTPHLTVEDVKLIAGYGHKIHVIPAAVPPYNLMNQ